MEHDRSTLAGAAPVTTFREGLRVFLTRHDILLAFIVLVTLSSLASDRFLTVRNALNIARQVSIIGTAALGATLVIITSGIDLSVGPVMVIGCMVVGLLQGHAMLPVILAAVAVGGGCGAVNGLLVTKLRIPPFIATFGMSGVFAGLAYISSTGIRVVINDQRWWNLGSGELFGFLPVPVVFYVGAVAVTAILLSRTVFGTYLYGMGANETALRFSGVKVDRAKFAVYSLAGMVAGLAGVILAGRLREADPGLAFVYTLDVIAAVVLGGTRLEGGHGSIYRTVVGTLLTGVVSNIMNLLNVSAFYQQAAKGLLIITVLSLLALRKEK